MMLWVIVAIVYTVLDIKYSLEKYRENSSSVSEIGDLSGVLDGKKIQTPLSFQLVKAGTYQTIPPQSKEKTI